VVQVNLIVNILISIIKRHSRSLLTLSHSHLPAKASSVSSSSSFLNSCVSSSSLRASPVFFSLSLRWTPLVLFPSTASARSRPPLSLYRLPPHPRAGCFESPHRRTLSPSPLPLLASPVFSYWMVDGSHIFFHGSQIFACCSSLNEVCVSSMVFGSQILFLGILWYRLCVCPSDSPVTRFGTAVASVPL